MDKNEKVARAMCLAAGNDPDILVTTSEMQVVFVPSGPARQVQDVILMPLWKHYTGMAHMAIRAIEELP